jgi:hypothetical protein
VLKKYENMFRILENVTSYYFESILTAKERKFIVDSLTMSKESDFKKCSPTLCQMFETEKKF